MRTVTQEVYAHAHSPKPCTEVSYTADSAHMQPINGRYAAHPVPLIALLLPKAL